MKLKIIPLFILLIIFSTDAAAQGFLKVEGQKIVNDNGEYILKGIGLGGWMLMEGYMFKTSGFANAEHEIREKIVNVVGDIKADEFFDYLHQNFVTEGDIDEIAEWGFNSIRLPMHYNKLTPEDQPGVYLEEGFEYIDNLLKWCKKNEMYLILDLHAAPGGQSDEPISDYDSEKPSLWESEQNKERTIDLWRVLAERYADEEWIGGYDLINEPKWDLGNDNAPLRELMVDITNAIREVDTNHIVFIEGNWFATNFNGLAPAWDDNLVWSFHKYWNVNTKSAIQGYLDLRAQTNRPLWLGETGENSNVWFTDCARLMEENNIGWAWWPLKKIESIAGPLSAEMTEGYSDLLDFWNGQGSKPSPEVAFNSLIEQLDKLKLANCRFQPGVVDALIRQTEEETSIPFKEHSIPGKVFFTEYDMGPLSVAYFDQDYHNIQTDDQSTYNSGYTFRNDGVDIEECSDVITNGYNVGWIESGEYLTFTVDVAATGTYSLSTRVAANESGGKVIFYVDNVAITSLVEIPITGGWQNWNTLNIGDVELTQGQHIITVKLYFGGFNINYFELRDKNTDVQDDKIKLNFNLEQNYPNPFNSQTQIGYTIPKSTDVNLTVFDSTGRKVTTLVDKFQEAGDYRIAWKLDELTSGVYFYSLNTSAGYNSVKKALFLK